MVAPAAASEYLGISTSSQKQAAVDAASWRSRILLVHRELSQWEREYAAPGGLTTYTTAFEPFCEWLSKQPAVKDKPAPHVLSVQQMQSVSELNSYVNRATGRLQEMHKREASKLKLASL